MPDLAKIKRNVSKMVSLNAPETDIDSYIQSEGVTIDDIRNFKPQTEEKPQESIGQMLLGNLKEAGQKTYKEGIAPILEGGSTFAAGLPRLAAKIQGKQAEKAVFPEQETPIGKTIRGISETAGFTAGLPGRVALKTAQLVGQGAKALPKFLGKSMPMLAKKQIPKLATRLAQGVTSGAVGGAVAGDTLENRKKNAITGAVTGGVVATAAPVAKSIFNWAGNVGRTLSGVEKEVYEEASKKGFRNVLQSKYYNKKLPAQIQNRIAQNLDNMESAASIEYDNLVTPLKQSPFDMAKLRGDVIKIANRVKDNPFDTENSKIDQAIMDGIINKAKANNLGQALDMRRNLDDIIYSNKGDLKSSFGKQVRDLLNKELHKNKDLAKVDTEWSSLMETLKDSRKILGDTGEKILDRFSNMTDKQKSNLVDIEKKIGGLPFMEDLTNYSLAKEFISRKVSPSVPGVIRAAVKPATRGFLRQGERFTNALGMAEEKGKEVVGRLLR
jgi:hypothetical protein